MRKIIIGIPNCPKCQMLKTQHPDAEYIETSNDDMVNLLVFARMADIKSMPFVVCVGDVQDLDKILK